MLKVRKFLKTLKTLGNVKYKNVCKRWRSGGSRR